MYYGPGKGVRNKLLHLLHAHTLYQSLHAILFVIARWRRY